MTSIKKIFSSKTFFAGSVLVLILLLNLIPYWFGYTIKESNTVFIGVYNNLNDVVTYLAEMQQGAEGNWLVYNQFTSEEQQPALIFIFYIILGKVAKLLGLSVITAFFIARIVFGLALFIFIYFFVKYFVRDVFWSNLSTGRFGSWSGLAAGGHCKKSPIY